MATAFFYGTLMHPKILQRVIGNDGSHLEICPALLMDFTRHHVKHADYPAIVPYERSKGVLLTHDLSPEEKSVRGTLVSGLTPSDIELLDIFEGNEYIREEISVHPLGSFAPLASLNIPKDDISIVPTTPPPIPDPSQLPKPLHAQTYVWAKNVATTLDKRLWSFDEFVRQNAWKWVGKDSGDNEDYKEVDRRRAMGGEIIP
ncbi:hypothetical protein OF83DRAFT_1161124 [Amylostereum chailletii]|nr:hypothetical protein OF83DRAFT_1161124 [Amylostereum chailletii]